MKTNTRYTEQGYINMIIDFFGNRGWIPIEQDCPGAFTRKILISSDQRMIAKISGPDRNMYNTEQENQDTYPEFAKWATTQNNPHLPKIYQARSLRYYGLFLTIMERLEHLNYNKIEAAIYDGSVYYLPEHSQMRTAGMIAYSMQKKNLGILAGENFRSVVDIIVRMTKYFGCLPTDLHSANMMLRGNTLVLTDPYSWIGKLQNQIVTPVVKFYTKKETSVKCYCTVCIQDRRIVRKDAKQKANRIAELADMLMGRRNRK